MYPHARVWICRTWPQRRGPLNFIKKPPSGYTKISHSKYHNTCFLRFHNKPLYYGFMGTSYTNPYMRGSRVFFSCEAFLFLQSISKKRSQISKTFKEIVHNTQSIFQFPIRVCSATEVQSMTVARNDHRYRFLLHRICTNIPSQQSPGKDSALPVWNTIVWQLPEFSPRLVARVIWQRKPHSKSRWSRSEEKCFTLS